MVFEDTPNTTEEALLSTIVSILNLSDTLRHVE
jgi:hypothetical protein